MIIEKKGENPPKYDKMTHSKMNHFRIFFFY